MSMKEHVPRSSMRIQQSTAGLLCLTVAATLCFPPATCAQGTSRAQNQQNPSPLAPVEQSGSQSRQQTAEQKSQSNGTAASPAPATPPQPVTTYPDAAGNPQPEPPASNPSAAQSPAPQTEPQGAATAEKVPAAGGAAAKPAGAAIAPAKQRQARSLLLKLGAVAAGAVAAGTIYALSRGTPSTPPGSTSPGAVQKRHR